jgi:hypothetical protein
MLCDGPYPAPEVLLKGLICEVLEGGEGVGNRMDEWMDGRINVMNVV